MLDTIRAFIAVNLEVAAVRRVTAVQRALRSSRAIVGGKLSWVASPNMHVTLRFLGSHVDTALIPAVADALRDILADVRPMRLELGPLDAFPSQERARIVMVRVHDPEGQLEELAARVEQMARSLGFPPEKRPFHAHVTLARIRRAANVTAWFADIGPHNLESCWATECTIYESTLAPGGAEYKALRRFPLPKGKVGNSKKRKNRQSQVADGSQTAMSRAGGEPNPAGKTLSDTQGRASSDEAPAAEGGPSPKTTAMGVAPGDGDDSSSVGN